MFSIQLIKRYLIKLIFSVMRTQGSLRVVLNTKIWPGMTIERASVKSVRITAMDTDETIKIFLIMVRQFGFSFYELLMWDFITLKFSNCCAVHEIVWICYFNNLTLLCMIVSCATMSWPPLQIFPENFHNPKVYGLALGLHDSDHKELFSTTSLHGYAHWSS